MSAGLPRVPLDVRRVAAVALLTAAATLGLRAHGALTLSENTAAVSAAATAVRDVLGTLAAASALACVVLITTALRGRRRRRQAGDHPHVYEEPPLPWWARPAALLLVLTVLVVPVVLLILQAHGHPRTSAAPAGGTESPPVTSPAPGSRARSAGSGLWPAAAVIVLAAAAAILLFSRRHPPAACPPVRAPRPTGSPVARQPLAGALAAGAAALGRDEDPRAAIIGCYAAMERSMTAAGSAPVAADTPAEVLARAASGGLVRLAAASTLTGLFREARYSAHRLQEADRATALEALARLRDDVGDDDAGDQA